MIDLLNFTFLQLLEWSAARGFPAVHCRRLWRYLYHDLVTEVEELTELPIAMRRQLPVATTITELASVRNAISDNGLTRKHLLSLQDGAQIETVEMHTCSSENNPVARDRITACLSTQIGCAMGCVFCATGQQGFTRDLTTAEIVAQARFVARSAAGSGRRLSNIVLMGMGEPLLNYDSSLGAADILHDGGGFAIGAKQITISTVGVIPGIRRLIEERRKYSLAVSLHAATQAERLRLIPAARPWPLDELIAACLEYTRQLRQKIFFEWTLIAGSNDSRNHARELARLIHGIPAQVNLIPLNPTNGFSGEPGQATAMRQFQEILKAEGIPSSVRQRRGIDIAAGCGQLAADSLPAEKIRSRESAPL